MKRRRHHSEYFAVVGRGKIGVAFQTDLADVLSGEHPRINGAVRLMTGRAAFEANRRVFEREGSPDFRMALEATGFVARSVLHVARAKATVRIVAIEAGHGVLNEAVGVGLLELRPRRQMAASAELVDLGRLSGDQMLRTVVRVDRMAGRAGNLILGVATHNAAGLCGLVEVAS